MAFWIVLLAANAPKLRAMANRYVLTRYTHIHLVHLFGLFSSTLIDGYRLYSMFVALSASLMVYSAAVDPTARIVLLLRDGAPSTTDG